MYPIASSSEITRGGGSFTYASTRRWLLAGVRGAGQRGGRTAFWQMHAAESGEHITQRGGRSGRTEGGTRVLTVGGGKGGRKGY